ncbi:MAG: M14 family metallopeptidase [Flammeovirgaceae bacterium]
MLKNSLYIHLNLLILSCITLCSCQNNSLQKADKKDFITKFESSGGTQTVTYHEGIAYLEKLSEAFPQLKLQTFGETDGGYPLHVAFLSANGQYDEASLRNQNVILINNAIHPGEPDGVEASLMLLRDLLFSDSLSQKLGNVTLAVIPFYNIGGTLNRNSTTRVNQLGPDEYGFRGSGQNLDLNRDFVKCDSKNAQTITQIFHYCNPDIFIDTHTTNGADYQHVMTNLYSQEKQMSGNLGMFLKNTFLPDFNADMKKRGFEMSPYVSVFNQVPDSGFVHFMDSPRYSSGYGVLFHTLTFVSESHMLKPFDLRVRATYQYLLSVIDLVKKYGNTIKKLRQEAGEIVKNQEEFVLEWKLNPEKYEEISFNGYEAKYLISEVSGKPRLFYDRTKPYTKKIKFFNEYEPKITVQKPYSYIIPQAWSKVIERLQWNKVQMERMTEDREIEVGVYYIESYQTSTIPYEWHYYHYDTQIRKEKKTIRFLKGDYIIPVNQAINRYIIEMLEPQAPDSFFNWNFFDPILRRKEYFSDYIFEDLAAQILKEDASLKAKLEEKKKSDKTFAENPNKQLDFIYSNSKYAEESYLRYPVYRLEK